MGARKTRHGRLGPPALLRAIGEAGPISCDAEPVKRHRSPVDIFSRMLVCPLIGVGA